MGEPAVVMELEAIEYGAAPWTVIDESLFAFDQKSSARDYWLGRCVLDVSRRELWRSADAPSMNDYFRTRLGWDYHTLRERLRTAEMLEGLPLISAALREGRIRWTIARELSRVATVEKEEKWLKRVKGKTTKWVAMRVQQANRGDDPDDNGRPDKARKTMRLDCTASEFAILRAAIIHTRHKLGEAASEMSEAALLATALQEKVSDLTLELVQCPSCRAAGVHVGDSVVAVQPIEAELAACSGRVIGETGEVRVRHVPEPVRRAALIRAGHVCEIFGCSYRYFLLMHHLDLWSEGGGHTMANLMAICGTHHRLLHAGALLIEGNRRDGFVFRHADGTELGKKPGYDMVNAFKHAFTALREAGVKEGDVREALRLVRERGEAKSEEEIVIAASAILSAKSEGGPEAFGWKYVPQGTPIETANASDGKPPEGGERELAVETPDGYVPPRHGTDEEAHRNDRDPRGNET